MWWVAPTYDLCTPGLDACETLYPPEWVERITTQPGNISITFTWGGLIEFKSAEKERSMRGRGLRGLLVEEAGEIKDNVWDILRPTLADYRAPAFIFSSPKGRNWFWQLAMRGLNGEPGYETFIHPTAMNPFISKEEIEEARRNTPDRLFRQEWLAEFISDAGGVFPNPRRLVRGELSEPRGGERYVIGWDPAKHHDYSAICIDRIRDRHTVHFQRLHKAPYPQQTELVARLARDYKAPVVLDVGGPGDPIWDYLVAAGVEVWPYRFTHTSKQSLINNLAMHIGEGSTTWPDLPVLTNELEIYEWKEGGKSGAPDNAHDDSVMAKALAVWGISRGASYLASRDAVTGEEKVTDYL